MRPQALVTDNPERLHHPLDLPGPDNGLHDKLARADADGKGCKMNTVPTARTIRTITDKNFRVIRKYPQLIKF